MKVVQLSSAAGGQSPNDPGQLLSVGSQPTGGKVAEATHHDQAAPREMTGVTGVGAEDLSEDALQIRHLSPISAGMYREKHNSYCSKLLFPVTLLLVFNQLCLKISSCNFTVK